MLECLKYALISVLLFVCVASLVLNVALISVVNDKNEVILACWHGES